MRKNEIENRQGDPGGDRLRQDLRCGVDTGFYMLLSVLVSIAVAIIAAAVAGRILMGETASAGTYWVITANMIAALVAVILWSISLVGMFRYLQSHYGNKQEGQAVSL